jgi:hypothetical protein
MTHTVRRAYMNGLSPGLRRFPLFESRFDGEKIFVFAVLRMSLDYRPSPGEAATPCRADYIFGEYLGQCVGELSVEYGNLSEATHSPTHRFEISLFAILSILSRQRHCRQNSANFRRVGAWRGYSGPPHDRQ